MTRNVEGDKSKALAEAGAMLVQADMNDLDSLKKAVQGADFIFRRHGFPDSPIRRSRDGTRSQPLEGRRVDY